MKKLSTAIAMLLLAMTMQAKTIEQCFTYTCSSGESSSYAKEIIKENYKKGFVVKFVALDVYGGIIIMTKEVK